MGKAVHKYAVHLMVDVEAVVVPSIVVAPVPGFQQLSLAREAYPKVRQTKYYNIEASHQPQQKRDTSFFLFR